MARQGNDEAALDVLLSLLDERAADGDATCALAAQALRQKAGATAFAPDAIAAALDRLVQLVRTQEEQIRALRAMVEAEL